MACWCVRPCRDSPFTSNISSPERVKRGKQSNVTNDECQDCENTANCVHAIWIHWCPTALMTNCSWASVSGVSVYLLSASHQLQLLHWGKWSWRIYPSSHGLSPVLQQYWIQDPRHIQDQCLLYYAYPIYEIKARVHTVYEILYICEKCLKRTQHALFLAQGPPHLALSFHQNNVRDYRWLCQSPWRLHLNGAQGTCRFLHDLIFLKRMIKEVMNKHWDNKISVIFLLQNYKKIGE